MPEVSMNAEVSRKRNKNTRKFDHVKKFGVKKKRWEVENDEIVSLEARLQDLQSVRSHARLGDIRDFCVIHITCELLL